MTPITQKNTAKFSVSIRFFLCLLCTLFFFLSACTKTPTPMPTSPSFTNEIIVRTAENFHTPEDVTAFVDMAARVHISVINLLVKQDEDAFVPSGQVYYRSEIAPIAPGYMRFDVLQTMLDAAHPRGIQVRAWMPQFHDQVAARQHPEWQMIALRDGVLQPYTGSRQEEYFVNPLHPDVQAYERSLIQEVVAKYPIDGIMLDWLRFDDYNMDLSEWTRAASQTAIGLDPLTLDFSHPNPALARWNDFRTDGIAAYVHAVRRALPVELPLGVYILPPEFIEVGQDAAKFNPDVQSLAPMCYFQDWGYPLEWVWESCLATTAEKAGNAEIVPTMDSHLTDEEYAAIFAHLRTDFPQVKTLAWFYHNQWTEERFTMIERVTR